MINGEVMGHLAKRGIIKLNYFINATFLFKYKPILWKVSEQIMIPKPGSEVKLDFVTL